MNDQRGWKTSTSWDLKKKKKKDVLRHGTWP